MSPSHMERLTAFHAELDAWLDVASDALGAQQVVSKRSAPVSIHQDRGGAPLESALDGQLKEALASKTLRLLKASEASTPVMAAETAKPPEDAVVAASGRSLQSTAQMEDNVAVEDDAAPARDNETETIGPIPVGALAGWTRTPLPEERQRALIAEEYGARIVQGLRIATITKSLILLAGAPGVGKSWLATRLLDDPERERSIIVPVSSTWRSREDLLGYVNPVTGEFEASEFTRFLRRCEAAWLRGDRRPHLVVFEEFNLSQPEHWLSDLLVRLEYESERVNDRTIQLGGTKICGEDDDAPPRIYLPPTLILAGTLNNDHTVRALSPRVLDRATLIDIAATGRTALTRVGITTLSPVVEEIVEDLNMLLKPRGVAFSVRTARLSTAIEC